MDTTQLRGHFDRHADEFDRLYRPGHQSPLERWLNRHFRSDIVGRYLATLKHIRRSGATSVLDIGCGPGHYLAALAAMGIPRLVGIDVSERMIELAGSHPDIAGNSNIELVRQDYLNWNSVERFDVVVAMGFFDYAPEPLPLLRRMREQSRLSTVASFPSRHWLRTSFRRIRRRLQGTTVCFYARDQIEELGLAAGFVRVDITKLPGWGMNFVGEFYSA